MESVYQLLHKKGELSGGLIAQTLGELVKMEIVGYVPYSLEYDLLSTCAIFDIGRNVIIGSNKVRFIKFQELLNNNNNENNEKGCMVSPIANTLSLGKEEDVLVTPSIRIFKYLPNPYKNIMSNYYTYWHTYQEDKLRIALAENVSGFSSDENQSLHYKTEVTDFICYQNKAGRQVIVAISDAFLCLCSYFSPITGCLEYVLKSPKDLIPVLK